MAVIYHTDRQEVEGILDSLRREADAANRDGNQLPLSYAYGWAISADYEGCIMQTLLDKADYCMYENKRAYYATHDRRAPSHKALFKRKTARTNSSPLLRKKPGLTKKGQGGGTERPRRSCDGGTEGWWQRAVHQLR